MFYIERFFQFLSKTDTQVINSQHCSKFARMTQTSLGVLVFITGVFAFLSGSFAVQTAFKNIALAVIVGILYGLMIMAFDREIVSATNKKAVWIRLPLAFFIGFIVSVPIEMRLLQDRLEKQLHINEKIENQDLINQNQASIDKLHVRRDTLENDVQKYRDQVARWSDAMEAEVVGRVRAGRTGKAGEGPAYREAARNRDLSEKLLNDTVKQLKEVGDQQKEEQTQIENTYQRGYVHQTYGFLSQFEALEQLKEQSAAAWRISWMLRLLFIFIEVFPALVKLLLPYSAYNAILEARRRESIQLVHALTNHRMTGLGQQPPTIPATQLMAHINQVQPNTTP